MKNLRYFTIVLFLGAFVLSCSDDTDDPYEEGTDPLQGYTLLSSIKDNGHTLEMYGEQANLIIGYNSLAFRLKDAGGALVENPSITWMPVMHMMDREHSCPKSTLSSGEDPTIVTGYAVFQMPGNASEYWDITFEYDVDGEAFSAKERITVSLPADGMKHINIFEGLDGKRYILAMMPFTPEVKVNDFTAMLFRMESIMSFPVVQDFTIGIDPRMPGMGNHSSPNNEDLSYDPISGAYNGKLSLTMTGYWKVNLQLFGDSGELLGGEEVNGQNEASSLYFDLEF